MKTQYNKPTIALAVLLLAGSSLAHATPVIPNDTAAVMWQWLFSEPQQLKSQLICESFPFCSRALPPEQPEKPTEKK